MRSLLIVDLQNDFCPGGALAVPGGHELAAIANRQMPEYELVVASQDWHPLRHVSFAALHPGKQAGESIRHEGIDQLLWPIHCVQHSFGARLVPELDPGPIQYVARKGTDPAIDSYSAFYDNGHRRSTGLTDYLRGQGVKKLEVMGLALDYCVKFTVLDALKDGFSVTLLADACRAINLRTGDDEAAVEEMRRAGAEVRSIQ